MAPVDSDAGLYPHQSARFVVGLGASAGGIEALKAFFKDVRPDSGAAYVVVLHLSPDHESRLAEVLQVTASIPVVQVTERVRVAANQVYVVSPNKLLSIDHDWIVLSEITRFEQRRAPVDLFFQSLADAQGARSVCVILSGTGPNGSVGLKRVKEYGGLVLAQDPDEADYSDMPRNAIATGLVDYVLPIAEMPEKIRAFHERCQAESSQLQLVSAQTRDPEAMREILTLLRLRTGHDFSHYKPGSIQRRIERRIHVRGLPSIAAYARTMRENPDEALALMRELLISVTSFFRDPGVFDAFAQRIVPRLFLTKGPRDQVRVWVPACATGEEAYSVAMVLAEYAAKALEHPRVQVFATDLDERTIAVAREGLYTTAEVAELSEERLQRFFTRESGGYRIRREMREMILFAHHDVLKDPPFSHLDLISCRNLLIYLNRTVQERLIQTFHFALRPGGLLMLGASESPETDSDLFTLYDKTAHVYESRSVAGRVAVPIGDQGPRVGRSAARPPEPRIGDRISAGELHQRLLELYAPPSVVVTDQQNVVHMSETVGRYMQVPAGEPTRDLLRLVHEDLRPDLRSALYQAARERREVRIQGVRVKLPDAEHRIDIAVRPVLRELEPASGYILVTFSERGLQPAEPEPRELASQSDSLTAELEEEITKLKLQLRATIEQYETQADEARAANEELQAMNEELRSTAEELETSREELQSVNEELTTVNEELKIKIEEVGLTNNDFQNLINSSDVGTIFLDRELQVKLSTPAANQIFNLRRTDIGRPLSDITSQLLYDHLHEDIQQVLEQLHTLDREVETRNGRWTLMRIRPYRTLDDRIDGVVITFQDITERVQTEARLRQRQEQLRLLIDGAADYAVFTMNVDGVIDSWNAGAERMFGYKADEIVGQHYKVLFTPEDRGAGVPGMELKQVLEAGRIAGERFHVRRDGSRFYGTALTTRLAESQGFATITRDLSAQQQAQDALRVVQAEFDARVRERTDRLEAEVSARAAAHHHVSSFLKKIVTAQEDERARIARDLHDQLGQQLTALRLTLEQCRERLAQTGAEAPEVDRALTLTHDLDREIDFLAWELRPAALDDLGLAAALPRYVNQWSSYHGLTAEYRDRGFAAGQLPREAEVVFYRVAQEALNNVAKHAHASRVDVLLEARDSTVLLVVEDDGIGFDPADPQARENGVGLIGMRERAASIGAELQIESGPGEGTSIFLRCPIVTLLSKETP